MKKIAIIGFLLVTITSCFKGIKVDMIIHNATIHSMNSSNVVYQAMAIKDGIVIELGAERQILNRYRAKQEIDAQGKSIYPGLTDAHTHLLLLAQERLSANLNEVISTEQAMVFLEKYHSRNTPSFIIGRGLHFPSDEQKIQLSQQISEIFTDVPIFIITKDAHAAILNKKAIEYLKLRPNLADSTKGFVFDNGKFSGIIKEKAFFDLYDLFPKFDAKEIENQLFEIQDELLQYGIIAIHEMGWSNDDYHLFKALTENENWKINISAYLLPSQENKALLKEGIIKGDKMQIRGLKLFLDGTFGSQTAAISSTYKDGSSGKINYTSDALDSLILFSYNHELQLAVHAAGDRSAVFFLNRIKALEINVNNLNWRMEHLQKVNPTLLELMGELHILASVQPFHAVSDLAWLRTIVPTVGNDFYAYKSLYTVNDMILIGSDMPVETFNPFEIMWAASVRKDLEDEGSGYGFNMEEGLSIDEVLKGYTSFNAQIVDNGSILGSIEENKWATFFIASSPITNEFNATYNYATKTFIKGKETYSVE